MINNLKPLNTDGSQISELAVIAAALRIKDPYTQGHARRVAIYAGRLAQRLGLPGAEVENIGLGGLLHDIGKIGLSDRVFNNTNQQLSEELLAEVQRHPQIGAALLKNFDFPTQVIDYVRYHHEKMDGSGYPFGLRSYQIPLGAKIIRVTDCFDAITTDRPYQLHKSWIEALAILRQISGTDLSPELVEVFIEDIKENGQTQNMARPIWYAAPQGSVINSLSPSPGL
jgi:putative nucleotidyltransferase with HDIG domain